MPATEKTVSIWRRRIITWECGMIWSVTGRKTTSANEIKVSNVVYYSSSTLTLWRCFNKDDGGSGAKTGEKFSNLLSRTLAESPDISHAKRSPLAASHDGQLLLFTVLFRVVNAFGWIRHQKLNKHAPTDRLACWILLDLVALGYGRFEKAYKKHAGLVSNFAVCRKTNPVEHVNRISITLPYKVII